MDTSTKATSVNAVMDGWAESVTHHVSLLCVYRDVSLCTRMCPCVPGCVPVYQDVSLCTGMCPCVPGCVPVYQDVALCTGMWLCVPGCGSVYQDVSLCTRMWPCVPGCGLVCPFVCVVWFSLLPCKSYMYVYTLCHF